MTKKAKILIFFLLIILILILYLILTSESVKQINNPLLGQAGQPVKSQATALPEADAQAKVKEIFTAYEKLAKDNNFTTEKIAELKNKLSVLKGLPANFEKLALNFVVAMNNMEDYLKKKDRQAKNASQQMINQLKADYSWLNN